MQTLLVNMEENGGIPEPIQDLAKQIKNASDLDPGM
jgi:hypothetical protein